MNCVKMNCVQFSGCTEESPAEHIGPGNLLLYSGHVGTDNPNYGLKPIDLAVALLPGWPFRKCQAHLR